MRKIEIKYENWETEKLKYNLNNYTASLSGWNDIIVLTLKEYDGV